MRTGGQAGGFCSPPLPPSRVTVMKISLTFVVGIALAAVLAASAGVGIYMSPRYEALVDESTLQGDSRVMRELAADQIWNEHFKKVTEVAQAVPQAGTLRAAPQGSEGAAAAPSR